MKARAGHRSPFDRVVTRGSIAPRCLTCEDFDAYPQRPTCAQCDPDDCIRTETDPRIPACRVAFRLGGWDAVNRLLGTDPDDFNPAIIVALDTEP